jgi:hypothetical protein
MHLTISVRGGRGTSPVIGVRWVNEPEEGRGLEEGRDACCGGRIDEAGRGDFGGVREGWLRLVAVAIEGTGKGWLKGLSWLGGFAVGTGAFQTGPLSNESNLGPLNFIASSVGMPRPFITSEIDVAETILFRIRGWSPISP